MSERTEQTELEPVEGFAVCRSCDPPRLVPAEGAIAHVFECHVISPDDILSVEVTDA